MIRKIFFFTVIAVLLYLSLNAQQTTFRINYDVQLFDIPVASTEALTQDNYIFSGTHALSSSVLQVDAIGSLVWGKNYSGYTFGDVKRDDALNRYFVCGGGTSSSSSAFLMFLDASGNTLSARNFSISQADGAFFNRAIKTSDGGYVCVGHVIGYDPDGAGPEVKFSSQTNNDPGCDESSTETISSPLIVKFDASGNHLWHRVFRYYSGSATPANRIYNDGSFVDVTEVSDGYIAVGNYDVNDVFSRFDSQDCDDTTPRDAMFLKTSITGAITYHRQLDNPSTSTTQSSKTFASITKTSSGLPLVSGNDNNGRPCLLMRLPGSGGWLNPTWVRKFDGGNFLFDYHPFFPSRFFETSDGNYAAWLNYLPIGFTPRFSNALMKINPNNNSVVFAKEYTFNFASILPHGEQVSDGGFIGTSYTLAGTGHDLHLIKADANGEGPTDCPSSDISIGSESVSYTYGTPIYNSWNTNNVSNNSISPTGVNVNPTPNVECRTIVCNAPPTPTASADNNNFCPGGSVTISATGSGPNTTYEIFDQASGGNSLGNAPQTFTPNTTTTYYVEAYENSDPLCVTPRDSVTVTVLPDTPNTPGTIAGVTPVCPGNNETYSISPVADASSYNWSLNGGGNLTGSGTSVNIAWTTPGTWTVSVNAENSCGPSSNQTLQVTVSDPPPAQPGAISGVVDPCPGSQSYSIASVSGATSYDWTLSGGGTISGSGTSIDVDWTSSGGPYTLSVVAENGCGSSAAQTLQVNVKDAAPSSIGNISGSDTVCVGAENYNIPSVNGASNYAWTISGGGNIASGQGTNNISINWTTTGTYTINVTAENDCGDIDATPYEVTVLPNAPVAPGNITGPIAVCPGVESYSISAVGGADSYTWTLSSGGNIVSGQGTNSIDVDWGSTTGNYTLSVTANSICGSSNASTLSVDVTSGPPSGLPTISGTNPACPGTETYTVSGVTGASTYTWSVDAGGSINSGQGTSSVDINWANSGGPFTIEVFSENSCGAGDTNTLAVFVDSIPEFDGDTIVGAIEICPGTENYSIGSVANANSYNWTLSGGGSIASGQGSNSISVDWTTSGGPYTLSVEPVNDCGSGLAVSQNINVLPGPPSTPPSITGEVTICEGSGTELYVVETVPNATDYVWTMLNGGGTIVSGQGTDSILIDWTGSPGNYQFSVRAENSCGFSADINHSVNIIAGAPAQPLAINGPIEICPGTENYSIASVQDASSYNWILSAGGNIVSGQGSENIEVNWTTSGGPYTLSVIAENTCGSSSAQNLEVNVLQSPSAPSVNVTANNICEGESTTINASGSSGGNISYQVYDAANGGNFLGNTSLDVSPQNTTTYYVEAVNESGCSYAGGRVPVEVVVLQAPNAPSVEVDNQSVCSGDSAVFTASASSGASINWWSAADGGTLLGTGTEFNTGSATESTTFYVSTTAANGCEQITARASVNLNVLENPSLSLGTDANNNSIFISEALTAIAEPDYYDLYQFFLNEEEVQIDSINTWASSILENGDVISVIATDAGCIGNKAEITITVNDFPNAFTPNGDGRNDIFLEGFDLVIVNRWGQELYQGSDGWDGTFNGKRVAPGTYFYIVKVQDITDKENIIKGSVLVHD
ncbi:MAG: gliding motility-associated C-terminal domain-containing protein [Chitinophagales bacterium]